MSILSIPFLTNVYGQVPTVPTSMQHTKADTSNQKILLRVESKIQYKAEDSIRFDRVNGIVHLYGKARIIYDTFELDADYISLDEKNNLVFAKGKRNPKTNVYEVRPIFKQGKNESPITIDSLLFNYKTQKGKSYGILSNIDQGYLFAKEFKHGEHEEGYFRNGVYTTCNLPHAHFGIHISRGVVTKKQIVSGPFFLEIEDVPTPLAFPFGIFPKKNIRSSGLIFPSISEDDVRGFFLRDLGYYIGSSDYWDLSLRTSIYTKGSLAFNGESRYEKRYKHSGNLKLDYALTYDGTIVEGTPADIPKKDFKIRWTHAQRPEANPGTTFFASVDIGTGSYSQNTAAGGSYNVNEIVKNTLASSISYGKNLGLFNYTLAATSNQDIQTRTISLQLPSFSLNMRTMNPLDKKTRVGDQKWYQKVTLGYSGQMMNSINTKDNLLFKPGVLRQFKNGISHSAPINLSLNFLKFFQINPNIQYREQWYLQTIRKRYDLSTTKPTLVTDTISGFSRAYDYSFSTNLSTKLYGAMHFQKGRLTALRHIFTPSFSLNYKPDFGGDFFGFYRPIDNAIPDSRGQIPRYSIFENGILGSPSSGKTFSLGFSCDNNLEAKRRVNPKSPQDTTKTFEKVPIIQSFSFRGDYNFAVDSFRLSIIKFSARTAVFKQKLGVNANGEFDPYQINPKGVRIKEYAIHQGQLARLTNLGLSFDLSLKSKEDNNSSAKNINQQQKDELLKIDSDLNAFVDFNIPWNLKISYRLQYTKSSLKSNVISSVNLNGDLNITSKWKITASSGFDFESKKVTLTQLSIYRDLHCWDLSFSWIPIGSYRSYTMDLKVKASILQDLKWTKRKTFHEVF